MPAGFSFHFAEYVPVDEVMRCAHPFERTFESLVKGLPEEMPVKDWAPATRDTTTSTAAVVVTGPPEGVAEAAWLFSTAV